MGEERKNDLLWQNESQTEIEGYIKPRRLVGFKAKIHVKRIENDSTEGVRFLEQLREIEKDHGL